MTSSYIEKRNHFNYASVKRDQNCEIDIDSVDPVPALAGEVLVTPRNSYVGFTLSSLSVCFDHVPEKAPVACAYPTYFLENSLYSFDGCSTVR